MDAVIRYSDHQIGPGPAFHRHGCALGARGHRLQTGGRRLQPRPARALAQDQMPQPRGIWSLSVGPTPRAAGRSSARYCSRTTIQMGGSSTPPGRLRNAAPTSSRDLLRRFQPLETKRSRADVAPPRSTRFRSPLVLSRVHWVRPKLVVESQIPELDRDGLLRQVVYEGIREDKTAREVVRETPFTSARG